MNLASVRTVREILKRHGLEAKKSLGQNFLTDGNTLRRIMDAAEITARDSVLEIGAGLGILTRELSQRAKQVLSVELDRTLSPVLAETLDGLENARVIFADFLRIDLDDLLERSLRWKVVANLPYYITTPILFRLLDKAPRLERLVFLVQKEVAQRVVAPAGNKVYGALSVSLQHRCHVKIAGVVPPTVFIPQPKVESAILVLVPKVLETSHTYEQILHQLVENAFRFRRKTLNNAWSRLDFELISPERFAGLWQKVDIDPGRRGESLSVQEFEAAAAYLAG